MTNFTHLRAVYYLIAFAVAIALAYAGGMFDKQFDMLEEGKVVKVTEIAAGDTHTTVEQFIDRINITCNVKSIEESVLCGGTFWTQEILGKGFDISSYDSLEIGVKASNEPNNQKLKLTFKNYNEAYSTPEDVVSHKYNSVALYLDKKSHVYDVPLDYFQVESWWMLQYDVRFDEAQTDLSNIQSLEVMHNDIGASGAYTITVFKLRLHGEWLNQMQIMAIIMFILVIAVIILIDRQREQQKQLSFVDPLTKLDNRRGLQAWIDKFACSEKNLKKVSLLFMDIDDFKYINDTYGHLVGDKLLVSFCELVKEILENQNYKNNQYNFTRLSGDEFGVLLVHSDSKETARLGEQILTKLQTPLQLFEHTINLSVSIGVASDILDSNDIRKLFNKADAAMYFAKRRGKNQLKIFDIHVEAEQVNHKRIADELTRQIANDTLSLRFLPIYNSRNKQVNSVEVVLHSEAELLSGLDNYALLSIAQDFGISKTLDLWVITKTLKLLNEHAQVLENLDVRFCINVSSLELQSKSFANMMSTLLQQYNIPSKWITLEISETAVSGDPQSSIECLNKLREMGIGLTLDEFGVGATSLSLMVYYPVDSLKIHESYIKNLNNTDDKTQLVVRSIISVAKTCRLQIIAEGVNNLEQFYCLQDMECDMIQGLIFCDPLTIQELIKALQSHTMFGEASTKSIE